MAQLLFETLPVSVSDSSENPTVITVHRMLDQQVIAQYETGQVPDDSDVFQCGRCKKQFSSISIFVNHKTECNNSAPQISDIALPSSICGIPHNAVVVQKIQIPSSSLTNYPQSLILTETEILQLTAAELNSNITTTAVTSPSLQINPNHSVVQQTAINSETTPNNVQHVLRQVTSDNSHQPETVELSILNDKGISRPLILTSQQHNNSLQSFVFNISHTPHPETVIYNNSDADKTGVTLVESTPEAQDILATDKQAINGKEPSTVNIITEFHSSMVKSKKHSSESETEDNSKKDHKLNCAYCWKSFTKNFDLQQHIRCHTGEKPFQCIVCGRAFAQKSNVKKHMQTHKVWPDGLARTLPPLPSKDNPDELTYTIQGEQTKDGLEFDKSGDFDKSSYVCPYCKYIAKSYYKLKSHMKQHDTEKVYKCIVTSCGQMFNDLDPFLEHTRSHENEMTYRCHECNKNFPSLFDLGSHQLTHAVCQSMKSQSARRYFQCNLCLNKYSTPAALDHHLATSSHTYSCTLCDKVFPCERYLRRHLQIHSEVESFTCNLCGKGFKTEGYLKVHMLVHSEEKPYECTTCKAAFNRKDKLKRHMLIHEPVKRFKCPFRSRGCPKEFNRPDKLKSHIVTHSCIKPFNCKVCGRTFTRKAHLRDHIKHNHDEEELKSIDNSKQLDKNSSIKSLTNGNSHKCKKSSNRKKKIFNGNYRNFKQRKKANSRNENSWTKSAKDKELVNFNVIDEDSKDIDGTSDLADDIPTAHIEIISADGTLVTGSELAHISLAAGLNYDDLQFDANVVSDVPNDSPITVQVIDTSNSNSLLNGELNPATEIDDFS